MARLYPETAMVSGNMHAIRAVSMASALHQFDTDTVGRCDITQQSPPDDFFNATGKRTPLARSSSQKARKSP